MYKLSLYNSMAVVFRNKNLSNARRDIDALQQDFKQGLPLHLKRVLRFRYIPYECFLDAKKILTYLQKNDECLIRVEGSSLSVFSNNLEWISALKNAVTPVRVLELWEPDPSIVSLLEPKVIVVNGPVEYKYKVTLGPKGDPSFAKWAEQNPHHIKIGDVAKKELAEDGWVNGYYFYAKNDKSLQICTLMIGNNIRRVDTLVSKHDLDK